jgi:hypothetical protein
LVLAASLAVSLVIVSACHETEHAPYGSVSGGPLPGGSEMPPTPDGGTDADTDTDQDGGPVGCAEDEVESPLGDSCWLRCPIGQTWSDGVCSGSALAEDWEGAIAACSTVGDGHHLPSRQEMIDILDNCDAVLSEGQEGYCDSCGVSAACGAMFDYDSQVYWTSSEGTYAPWAVGFDSGFVFMSETELDLYYARCLRSL